MTRKEEIVTAAVERADRHEIASFATSAEWACEIYFTVTHWMPIPKLPKK